MILNSMSKKKIMTSIPLAVSFDCTPPENASKIQKSLTTFKWCIREVRWCF